MVEASPKDWASAPEPRARTGVGSTIPPPATPGASSATRPAGLIQGTAAVTARLAAGDPLDAAVRRAKDHVHEAIAGAFRLGLGALHALR